MRLEKVLDQLKEEEAKKISERSGTVRKIIEQAIKLNKPKLREDCV